MYMCITVQLKMQAIRLLTLVISYSGEGVEMVKPFTQADNRIV